MPPYDELQKKKELEKQKQQANEFMKVIVETLASIDSKSDQEDLSAYLIQIKEAIESIPEQKDFDVSPVVNAIKEIKYPEQKETNLAPIVQAIKNIPEVKIPEQKEVDIEKVIKAIPDQKETIKAFNSVNKRLEELISINKNLNISVSASNGNNQDVIAAIGSIGGGATGLVSGRKVVAITDTAIALGSGASKTVFINALTTNSDVVVVGDSGVVYAAATRTGKILYPGDFLTISIDDISKIFINGTASDGVSFSYTT